MRCLVIVHANDESEKGVLPDEKMLTEMTRFNEELVKAGVMLAGEGLRPSSDGVRVTWKSAHEVVVTDGPFAATDELVAGFWIWQVKSVEEAVEWLKRAPFGAGAEIEVRLIHEAEDFGDNLTPELRDAEARLRAQAASNARAL